MRVQAVSPGSPSQHSSENTHQSPRPREQLHPVYQAQNKSQASKSGKGKHLQAASVNLLSKLDVNFTTSVEGLDQKMAAVSPDQTTQYEGGKKGVL